MTAGQLSRLVLSAAISAVVFAVVNRAINRLFPES